MTNQAAAKQALQRRQKVARPVTAPAAVEAVAAPEATAPPAVKPSEAKPAATRTERASSTKPKPSGGKATGSKRPAGTKRVTLDADEASLEAFQERIIDHGWSQRAGLTAALNLFLSLDDEKFDELCRKAQIDARKKKA